MGVSPVFAPPSFGVPGKGETPEKKQNKYSARGEMKAKVNMAQQKRKAEEELMFNKEKAKFFQETKQLAVSNPCPFVIKSENSRLQAKPPAKLVEACTRKVEQQNSVLEIEKSESKSIRPRSKLSIKT